MSQILPPFPASPLPAQEIGRAQLADWRASLPTNFYTADRELQRVLRMHLGEEEHAAIAGSLAEFGECAATVIDPAAAINDRSENHPRLDRWNGIGQRTENIEFHPSYHAAGRPAYASGILALQAHPGHALTQSALFYMLTQCGEMGHACPIVCTSGLIRTLQCAGDAALQKVYLPPLLDTDYDHKHTASQFLTEVQGGSDVGANAVEARPVADGSWRISGEKWFCSVANADQMLVTARPQGAPAGTRGIGVFLVPRQLPDGRLNGFHLRRLKTKFGTRAMASAEIDFVEALAYPIGDLRQGIHIVTELVLNTSRWHNAIGSTGLLRRAYLEAWHFAQQRQAFGQAIARYPLVTEALADMKSDLLAMMASTFRLSLLVDRMDLGLASAQERGVHRLLVNINKYWTSVQASQGIRRAQEILGGNGAIEDFSIIPRLYRDAVVFESWEGSHNVLCMQALKDMARYQVHEALFGYLEELLAGVTIADLLGLRHELDHGLAEARKRTLALLAADAAFQQTHIRRLVDRLAALTQAVCLLVEAAWETAQGLKSVRPDVLRCFLDRYLRPGYEPDQDAGYLPRRQRVAAAC